MSLAVTLVCAFGLQQLRVSPVPAYVGAEVMVHAHRDGVGIAALAVQVLPPGGEAQPCGQTGADGVLRFVPQHPGHHVFVATIDGVRTLAPLSVLAPRTRWPLALGAVPLGLALLWWNLSRARDRRVP